MLCLFLSAVAWGAGDDDIGEPQNTEERKYTEEPEEVEVSEPRPTGSRKSAPLSVEQARENYAIALQEFNSQLQFVEADLSTVINDVVEHRLELYRVLRDALDNCEFKDNVKGEMIAAYVATLLMDLHTIVTQAFEKFQQQESKISLNEFLSKIFCIQNHSYKSDELYDNLLDILQLHQRITSKDLDHFNKIKDGPHFIKIHSQPVLESDSPLNYYKTKSFIDFLINNFNSLKSHSGNLQNNDYNFLVFWCTFCRESSSFYMDIFKIKKTLTFINPDGFTLLHKLCYRHDTDTLKLLHYLLTPEEFEKLLKMTDNAHRIPLHLACFSICKPRTIDIIKTLYKLIGSQKFLELLGIKDNWNNTPLHSAVLQTSSFVLNDLVELCKEDDVFKEGLKALLQEIQNTKPLTPRTLTALGDMFALLGYLGLVDEEEGCGAEQYSSSQDDKPDDDDSGGGAIGSGNSSQSTGGKSTNSAREGTEAANLSSAGNKNQGEPSDAAWSLFDALKLSAASSSATNLSRMMIYNY